MYRLKKLILVFGVIFSSLMYGMERKPWAAVPIGKNSATIPARKNEVISFDSATVPTRKNKVLSVDLDGVVNGCGSFRSTTQVSDIMSWSPLIKELLANNPRAMDWHKTMLNKTETGRRPARVHEVYPLMAMIEYIRQLRAQGYTVIAATNQHETEHSEDYRTHMSRYSINLNEEFDGVLTRKAKWHSYDDLADDYDDYDNEPQLYRRLNRQDNIYAMCKDEDKKPHGNYYEAVKQLAASLNPTVTQVIHIDDMEENVIGAAQSDLVGIHFNPGGSIVTSRPEQLKAAVDTLKTTLAAHGVFLE